MMKIQPDSDLLAIPDVNISSLEQSSNKITPQKTMTPIEHLSIKLQPDYAIINMNDYNESIQVIQAEIKKQKEFQEP